MFKKITLIFLLAVGLATFLVLRPYIFVKHDFPRIEDRLPEADFLGRAYLLDVARETSGMMYYHKIPFRDLFSHEFILSQAKLFGLNLQKPLYFFANEKGDWGAIIEVSDSSKISDGIERIKKVASLKSYTIDEQRVYSYPEGAGYLTYSKNYLFIYKGKNVKTYLKRVMQAKRNSIAPCWKAFLKEKQFKDEKLVLYSNWNKLKENGIETALFAHNSDSVSFSLMTYIRSSKPLNIKMKGAGKNFKSIDFTDKLLNIHLDMSKRIIDEDDPAYKFLVKMGKKISFPTNEFLEAWGGDLSFRQGGSQVVKETYIESVLDDDFNVTEVEKQREVKVPSFSLLFSVNEKGEGFFKRLISKGILTHDKGKYRFLFSPSLTMKHVDNYYIFHSGGTMPLLENHAKNHGIWTKNGTQIKFSVDSLSKNEVLGSIYIPVNRIIRRNRFF